MKSILSLALALSSLNNTCAGQGRPLIEARYVICDRCGGTERTGCTCENVHAASRFKAEAKRNRKNAARLVQFARQRAGQLQMGV